MARFPFNAAVFMIVVLSGNGNALAREYSFDASMLDASAKNVDLSLFEQGGQLPGIYLVDILLNGSRMDSMEMPFHAVTDKEGRPYLKTCLTREILVRYGVKVEDYPALFPKDSTGGNSETILPNCANLSAIPQATENFQMASQQLLLGIPQVALRSKVTGLAPEALWDEGMSAFLLNYRADASRTEFRGFSNTENSTFWTSLEPGLNIGPWRVRNLSTWRKHSGQTGEWDTVYTRAERGLNGIKSRLTLGEHYTSSDVFDSVPFRGGMLASDENMVPYNQREFAPVIRGIARTQARVEVRQNGYLIHSLTVAPGAFALMDLPPTGSGGDLQVTVLETDGQSHVFTVPYSTPAVALREGYLKYSVTAGQYRASDSAVDETSLGQVTVMYGLPWSLTAFGGLQGADNYQSAALGLGLSMGNFGAISVDGIHARSKLREQDSEQGSTWRLRYSKSFELTNTSFTGASYQYSSDGYHTLADVLDTYRSGDVPAFRDYQDRRSRRTTLALSQSLGDLGYLSLNGSRDEYRNGFPHQDSLSVSYGTSWNGVSLNLNWTENRNTGTYYGSRSQGRTESAFNLWISVPLERWLGGSSNDIRATGQIQTRTGQDTSYEAGLNGRAFDRRLFWDVRERVVPDSRGATDQDSSRLNLAWYGTYGELSGMYSYSETLRQMNAGVSGGVVAHRNGITFGQRLGDTMALIEAPGAHGVSVGAWPGVKTDFRGYTTLGQLSAYQENVVSLNPTTLPEDAEVLQTDTRVVPTKGAIVSAGFVARVGGRALLTLTGRDGRPMPFGAVVTQAGEAGKHNGAGVVGDQGEVYMTGLSETGELLVQWGSENRQCRVNYRLPQEKGPSGVYLTRAECR
ncbi:fimbria/pilus outer membrane usher protein [Salmonella enterica]|nr:fimbria/pilus outer membrane usher protein [Salmonella enterica]EGK7719934.1 fimbria/pilus outer membrane usher protein [Salmonella enterica]